MKQARTLMVQGTASSAGKSLLVTALCRYFARHGIRVAPFKAQNMSLNAAVSCEGLEIGRAQAVQAAAAFVPASVEMNPILIKPESDQRAQLIVNGRPAGQLHASAYASERAQLASVVTSALERLRACHELVVIEGAGSPAEINLKATDIVNMYVAERADAPVLLVGDIDRGGVFASLVGTLALLEPQERARIAGFVINKFRGNLELLAPGLAMLKGRTGVPVLGVLPFLRDLRLPREDSVELGHAAREAAAAPRVEIAVIALPHVSNHDDFEPLEHEADVHLRWVARPEALGRPALIVLPGSKCTIADLHWLRARGFEDALIRHVAAGGHVLGICGGCQMLGTRLQDPHGVESPEREAQGLGLLPFVTRFGRDKVTANARARVGQPSFLTAGLAPGAEVTGYEIHMGSLELEDRGAAAFVLEARNGRACELEDGAVSANGRVVGTMLHGLFAERALRRGLIEHLSPRSAAASAPDVASEADEDADYDRLARVLAAHLDCERLWALTGLTPRNPWPEVPKGAG